MVHYIKVLCEWEIGSENEIYSSHDEARKALRKILPRCNIEEPLEELEDEGLVVYEYVTIVGEVRYHLATNGIGHEYAIPINKTDEWYKWVDTKSTETGVEPPEWAIRVKDGFMFTKPEF